MVVWGTSQYITFLDKVVLGAILVYDTVLD
jgi:hypothetical protein